MVRIHFWPCLFFEYDSVCLVVVKFSVLLVLTHTVDPNAVLRGAVIVGGCLCAVVIAAIVIIVFKTRRLGRHR